MATAAAYADQNIVKGELPFVLLLDGGNDLGGGQFGLVFDNQYLVPQRIRVHSVFYVVY